ncbi:MAG: hypothetical protein WC454_01525 [Phycisphaerae bacterium]
MFTVSKLRVVVCFLSVVFAFSGCRKSPAGGATHEETSEAVKTMHIHRFANGEDDVATNTCMWAVRQPSFSPVIDLEGAIVTFDNSALPMRGITTRVYDPKTGKDVHIRDLTDTELAQAASNLREHFREFIDKGIYTVVVHCSDFRLAAKEALTNTSSQREFLFEADIHSGLAKIYVVEGGARKLLAAEKIYYRSRKN